MLAGVLGSLPHGACRKAARTSHDRAAGFSHSEGSWRKRSRNRNVFYEVALGLHNILCIAPVTPALCGGGLIRDVSTKGQEYLGVIREATTACALAPSDSCASHKQYTRTLSQGPRKFQPATTPVPSMESHHLNEILGQMKLALPKGGSISENKYKN